MKMKKSYDAIFGLLLKATFIPLFLIRAVLSYQLLVYFIDPWVADSAIIAPSMGVWVMVSLEIAGVVLLTMGLATRIASAVLALLLLITTISGQLPLSFTNANRGVELLLFYAIGLIVLIVYGAGAMSIDCWIRMKCEMDTPLNQNEIKLIRTEERLEMYARYYEDF